MKSYFLLAFKYSKNFYILCLLFVLLTKLETKLVGSPIAFTFIFLSFLLVLLSVLSLIYNIQYLRRIWSSRVNAMGSAGWVSLAAGTWFTSWFSKPQMVPPVRDYVFFVVHAAEAGGKTHAFLDHFSSQNWSVAQVSSCIYIRTNCHSII